MKNDYLWDKTESDADIERLENLLSDLRYQPTSPPALEQKQLVFEPRRAWFGLSLPRVFAAAIAGLLLVGIWFLIPRSESGKSVASISTAPDSRPAVETDTKVLARTPETTEEKDLPVMEPKPVKTVYLPEAKTTRRAIPAKASATKRSKRIEALTSEEKYAYDQLKLALSITGSQLKAVSDTINRTED
jgi:hypothetical protein